MGDLAGAEGAAGLEVVGACIQARCCNKNKNQCLQMHRRHCCQCVEDVAGM